MFSTFHHINKCSLVGKYPLYVVAVCVCKDLAMYYVHMYIIIHVPLSFAIHKCWINGVLYILCLASTVLGLSTEST